MWVGKLSCYLSYNRFIRFISIWTAVKILWFIITTTEKRSGYKTINYLLQCDLYLIRSVRKKTFWHVRPTKTQNSLRIWSVLLVHQSLPCPYEESLHHWLSKMNWMKISIWLLEYTMRTCLNARFVLVQICRFPLPLGVWEGLRFVIVALPGLFSYFFSYVVTHCI